METNEKWMLLHEYNRQSVLKKVPAVLCPDDDAVCVTTADEDGEPLLRCIMCNARFTIGLRTYDQMKENLRELHANEL